MYLLRPTSICYSAQNVGGVVGELLSIENLRVEFGRGANTVTAVDGVDLEVREGEILGLVGESGSGKSVTSLSIMQLIPCPPGNIAGGKVLYSGKDLLTLDGDALRRMRGRDIAMIFQEPMTALNPVYRIGHQMIEAITAHEMIDGRQAHARCVEMLKKVGIPEPGKRMGNYPHELSGGMRQRVMIAMALLNSPKLLIADEPTTALDVTIQAQILSLITKLQKEMGSSVILITHDLGVVAETCHYVCVMYAGQIVEKAPVEGLYEAPFHPYTEGLLNSVPRTGLGGGRDASGKRPRFQEIPGIVPDLAHLPPGCRFADRCPYSQDKCYKESPKLRTLARRRQAACHFPLHQEGQA